jgi:hypothetical protein
METIRRFPSPMRLSVVFRGQAKSPRAVSSGSSGNPDRSVGILQNKLPLRVDIVSGSHLPYRAVCVITTAAHRFDYCFAVNHETMACGRLGHSIAESAEVWRVNWTRLTWKTRPVRLLPRLAAPLSLRPESRRRLRICRKRGSFIPRKPSFSAQFSPSDNCFRAWSCALCFTYPYTGLYAYADTNDFVPSGAVSDTGLGTASSMTRLVIVASWQTTLSPPLPFHPPTLPSVGGPTPA